VPYAPPGLQGPTSKSALTQLYLAIKAWFVANTPSGGKPVQVFLGLKYRDTWQANRVVIIDGEFDGTNAPRVRGAGAFRAPWQKASYNPRELIAWERALTISVWSADLSSSSNADSEQAQIEAAETLIEQTLQAMQCAVAINASGEGVGLGQANFDWNASRCFWVDPGSATQQTYGREFLFTVVYKCPLFDQANFVQQVTPALHGQMLTDQVSGSEASIATALPAGTSVISNLAFVSPAWVGMKLALSGAATPANNGAFNIAAVLGPTSLVIANSSAVADANNGAITWAVQPA